MSDEPDAASFDKSRAELFDALGHPVRIKILQALQDGPLGFSELRRRVGLESSGHLQFHLGKLDGLIAASPNGSYSLTDDGREALRVVDIRVGDRVPGSGARGRTINISRSILAGLVALMVLVGSVAIYQQWEIMDQNSTISNLLQQSNMGACGVNNQTGAFDFSPESSQVIAPSGLELNLTVSSGSIRCGDTVYANASLYNTLDSNLSLDYSATAMSRLTSWGSVTAYPCGSSSLLELAVFAGYWTEANFSTAGSPLQLVDSSVVVLCITNSAPATSLVILPDSGTAYRVSSQFPSLNGQLVAVNASLMHWACGHDGGQGQSVCGDDTGASGTYSSLGIGKNNGFHLFQFGEYTIAAGDDWGNVALVHFVVQ